MPAPTSMMKAVAAIAVTVAIVSPLSAAPKRTPPAPRDAAERFSLDLPPVEADDAVTLPPEAPVDARTEPATREPDQPAKPDKGDKPDKRAKRAKPAAETEAARFTVDTPIAQLLADYRSKAVLDRDMPGLSSDKNLDRFKPLSLSKLAPMSGGRLSPELLEKVGKHLAEIE
jgi:hypothetical protein